VYGIAQEAWEDHHFVNNVTPRMREQRRSRPKDPARTNVRSIITATGLPSMVLSFGTRPAKVSAFLSSRIIQIHAIYKPLVKGEAPSSSLQSSVMR